MLNFIFIYVKNEYYPNYKIDSRLYTSIYEINKFKIRPQVVENFQVWLKNFVTTGSK